MVEKELAKARDESSNRRSFVRKILGLGAAAGAATLLLNRDKSLLPFAQAGSGTGATVNIDQINYGVGRTEIRSTATVDEALKGYASATTGIACGVCGSSASVNGTGLYGYVTASTGDTYGVRGSSASVSGTGVLGSATMSTGSTCGVRGSSGSVSGKGVYGYATASTGTTYGVYGSTDSIEGRGVYGYATASTGVTYGVRGKSASVSGTGVYGSADASTGNANGVFGGSNSVDGKGVYGSADASTGSTIGVYGQSNSISGYGVSGYAISLSGHSYGVHGQSESLLGIGVQGYASATSGSGLGVYGRSNAPQGVSVLAYAGNISAKPMVARGCTDQTANLQEWQNNAGSALSVIDKNGMLGIGTSSPSFMLHIISGVTGPLTAASAPGAGPAPNSFICENLTPGNFKSQFTFRASGVNKWSFGNDMAGNGGQDFFIWDEVGAQAALYIDSSRRVGLGTLSPTEKLHVVGNVKAASFITGDVEFANGVKATEEGDGLAFINKQGNKIAVLDSEGNFYVKGEVRQLRY